MSTHHRPKRLYRSTTNRKLAGICGGFGEYFDVDPTVVRLIFIAIALFSVGVGVLAYLLAWIIMPEGPDQSERIVDHDETDSPQG